MQWTMPRPVVQGVGALIVLLAVTSFTLGVINAPQRSRLPGEKLPGQKAGATTLLDATDATPLSDERIEGPPPPPPEDKKAEVKDAQDEDAAADQADNATTAAPTNAANATTPVTTAAPTAPTPPAAGQPVPSDAPPF